MHNNKDDFIAEYEFRKDIDIKHSKLIKSKPTFLSRLTLRNVLIGIFFVLGIITLVVYGIVTYSYYKYGPYYENLHVTLKTMGFDTFQENGMLDNLSGTKNAFIAWVKVYKNIGPYIIIFGVVNLFLAIGLWAFCPNFKFKSLFRKRKG